MTRPAPAPAPRGFALFAVLGVVLLLSVIVAFTIQITAQERTQSGRQVLNQTLQNVTESALEYGKALMVSRYPITTDPSPPVGAHTGWDKYLGWFIDNPADLSSNAAIATYLSKVSAFDPSLIAPSPPGYSCFIYARDDIDEFPAVTNNNPRFDNNQLIYVGAVCSIADTSTGAPRIAELSATAMFVPTGAY